LCGAQSGTRPAGDAGPPGSRSAEFAPAQDRLVGEPPALNLADGGVAGQCRDLGYSGGLHEWRELGDALLEIVEGEVVGDDVEHDFFVNQFATPLPQGVVVVLALKPVGSSW